MIAIDMEMPLDCQGCRFCVFVESNASGRLICSATENWESLNDEYDKPKWCPLKIMSETVYCKDCKHYKRVYNDIGCELINFSGCEKGHCGYPNWSCADAEKAVSQCKHPYQWREQDGEIE